MCYSFRENLYIMISNVSICTVYTNRNDDLYTHIRLGLFIRYITLNWLHICWLAYITPWIHLTCLISFNCLNTVPTLIVLISLSSLKTLLYDDDDLIMQKQNINWGKNITDNEMKWFYGNLDLCFNSNLDIQTYKF